ncbi:SLATT domain-containing protein [Gordonia lacunae]|uniref:SLATT domain-containing protein n=1 Tax=Gordonia lacunae TaxID=417102 RepID=UPI0039E3E14B
MTNKLKQLASLVRHSFAHVDLKFNPPVPPSGAESKIYIATSERLISARDWYLDAKRGKRRASRAIRFLTILFTAAGAVVPLLPESVADETSLRYGYVLIFAGAAVLGFDRYFGVSAAWMRDSKAARQIDAIYCEYWLQWSRHIEGAAEREAHEHSISEYALGKLEQAIESETQLWADEFSVLLSDLTQHTEKTSPPTGSE